QATARQGYIDGFLRQPPVELGLRQLRAPLIQQSLDLLLDTVNVSTLSTFLLGVKLCQPFQQFCQRALLSEETGLGIFKSCRVGSLCKLFLRLDNQVISR